MLPIVLVSATLLGLMPTFSMAATVWKCQDGDRVVFSDAPCPSTGKQLDAGRLEGNVVRAERVPPKPKQVVDEGGPAVGSFSSSTGASRQSSGGNCPTQQDINNMQVSAGSATRDKKDKQIRRDEIRNAQQCRNGEGNYSAEDWKASGSAVSDQGSVSAAKRNAARASFDSIHGAANPQEAERIQQTRKAEQELQLARQQQAAKQQAAAQARQPISIASCSDQGCTDTNGTWYPKRAGTNQVIGPKGVCIISGPTLTCP